MNTGWLQLTWVKRQPHFDWSGLCLWECIDYRGTIELVWIFRVWWANWFWNKIDNRKFQCKKKTIKTNISTSNLIWNAIHFNKNEITLSNQYVLSVSGGKQLHLTTLIGMLPVQANRQRISLAQFSIVLVTDRNRVRAYGCSKPNHRQFIKLQGLVLLIENQGGSCWNSNEFAAFFYV